MLLGNIISKPAQNHCQKGISLREQEASFDGESKEPPLSLQ